jgi:hypothetical protein
MLHTTRLGSSAWRMSAVQVAMEQAVPKHVHNTRCKLPRMDNIACRTVKTAVTVVISMRTLRGQPGRLPKGTGKGSIVASSTTQRPPHLGQLHGTQEPTSKFQRHIWSISTYTSQVRQPNNKQQSTWALLPDPLSIS